MNWKLPKTWLIVAITLFAIISRFEKSIDPYYFDILISIGINILLGVGLNLVNGYTGQFSLGHAGFMAIGAYVASLLTVAVFPTAWGPLITLRSCSLSALR